VRTATVWQAIQIDFASARERVNPYLDVRVDVAFSGPDGALVRRPAFWDGDRIWCVRFTPPAAGTWTFEVSTDDPYDSGLNRASGEIEARVDPGARGVHQHGFLRAADGGRHLEHADGKPFFWLADTHWRFATERWDESNKPGWASQFRGTVDHRAAQGFTVYQCNLMAFGDGWRTSPAWANGNTFEELDPPWFRNVVDPRMAYVAEKGLVIALGISWYGGVDENPEGMARLARYLVARYGAHPMVWTLGGEVAGYDPELRQQRIDGWRQVALAIRDADGYDHPRTAHLTCERPIAPYYQGDDWLTLTLNQLGHGDFDLDVSHYADHLDKHPGTPLVEGESMYEGLTTAEYNGRRSVTATMVRHVAYRAMQSGCCGYSYGAQGCWNGAWDEQELRSPWGSLPWYEGVDLPGAVQLGHLRAFYEALNWTALRPAPECLELESWVNETIYRPNVSADPARSVVVAFFGENYRRPGGRAAFCGLTDSDYRVRLFDPREGSSRTLVESVAPASGRIELPDLPDEFDWLLVAERIS